MIRRRASYRSHGFFDYVLFSRLCALGLPTITAYYMSKVSNLHRLCRILADDGRVIALLRYAVIGGKDEGLWMRDRRIRAYLDRVEGLPREATAHVRRQLA